MSSKPSPLSVHFQPFVKESREFVLPSPADTIASGYSGIMSYGGYTPPASATAARNPSIRPAHESQISSYPLPTPSTQFCQAQHSYHDLDPAILSFSKGDVIEVLSKHPSGWWDGLVGGSWNGYGLGGAVRRGWIPSNYVRMLGREEARVAIMSLHPISS